MYVCICITYKQFHSPRRQISIILNIKGEHIMYRASEYVWTNIYSCQLRVICFIGRATQNETVLLVCLLVKVKSCVPIVPFVSLCCVPMMWTCRETCPKWWHVRFLKNQTKKSQLFRRARTQWTGRQFSVTTAREVGTGVCLKCWKPSSLESPRLVTSVVCRSNIVVQYT